MKLFIDSLKNRLTFFVEIFLYLIGLGVLAIILYVFYFSLIDLFILKNDPGKVGPIGDTFGGLLSPVIGLISIYFIYKTFKAQRDQLEDQKITNSATIKSLEDQRRLNEVTIVSLEDQKRINTATVSSIYLEEVKSWLTEIDGSLNNLSYKVNIQNSEITSGISSINSFMNFYASKAHSNMITNYHYKADLQLIERVGEICSKLVVLISFASSSSAKTVDPDYKLAAQSRINLSIKKYIPISITVFKIVADNLYQDPKNYDSQEFLNELISLYTNYKSNMTKLQELGYVSIDKIESIDPNEIDYDSLGKYSVDLSSLPDELIISYKLSK